jgi:hypothetical protein
MALCACDNRPRCEFNIEFRGSECSRYADWSVWQPRWRSRSERFIFMCDGHWKIYHHGMITFIPGIDRPPNADEFWRPSLSDAIRLACIKLNHERRIEEERKAAPLASDDCYSDPVLGDYYRWRDKRYTPGQLEQIHVWRRYCRSLQKPPPFSRLKQD